MPILAQIRFDLSCSWLRMWTGGAWPANNTWCLTWRNVSANAGAVLTKMDGDSARRRRR